MVKKITDISIENLDDVYKEFQKKEVLPFHKYSFIHKIKTKNKTISMSLGRIWFNLCLPDDFRLINEPIDKTMAQKIVYEIYQNYEDEKPAKYLSFLSKEIFKMSSICPISFGETDLIVPEDIKKRKEKEITSDLIPEEFAPKLEKLSLDYMSKLNNTNLGDLIKSKASGKLSPMDFAILTLAKGPVMDIEGKISKPITSSLIEGYNGEEYYAAASEARRAYHIRASGTAEPGYLARQVTFANSNTLLSKEDCKTSKYFHIFVRESIFSKILGRYYFDEITGKLQVIKQELKKKILNKQILLRSPLYCKSKTGICPICYGEYSQKLDTTKIGLIAGGAINQAGVEGYAMKARHQASQVNLKSVDFTQDLIHI